MLVRDLAKLSGTALLADAFILVGLVYIFGSEIAIVSSRGIADVKMFNPRDFSLFIGTAVFSFEGIGLVSKWSSFHIAIDSENRCWSGYSYH